VHKFHQVKGLSPKVLHLGLGTTGRVNWHSLRQVCGRFGSTPCNERPEAVRW